MEVEAIYRPFVPLIIDCLKRGQKLETIALTCYEAAKYRGVGTRVVLEPGLYGTHYPEAADIVKIAEALCWRIPKHEPYRALSLAERTQRLARILSLRSQGRTFKQIAEAVSMSPARVGQIIAKENRKVARRAAKPMRARLKLGRPIDMGGKRSEQVWTPEMQYAEFLGSVHSRLPVWVGDLKPAEIHLL